MPLAVVLTPAGACELAPGAPIITKIPLKNHENVHKANGADDRRLLLARLAFGAPTGACDCRCRCEQVPTGASDRQREPPIGASGVVLVHFRPFAKMFT